MHVRTCGLMINTNGHLCLREKNDIFIIRRFFFNNACLLIIICVFSKEGLNNLIFCSNEYYLLFVSKFNNSFNLST